MIPVIEDYLSKVLNDKMSYLKTNPEYLRRILSMDADKLNSLMTYITTTPIGIKRGYPRTPAELPCICIMLSSDNENQEGLGDWGEDVYTDKDSYTGTYSAVNAPFNPEGLGVPYVQLDHVPISSISEVINVSTGQYYDLSDIHIVNADRGIITINNGNVENADSIQVTFECEKMTTNTIQVQFEDNFRIEVWTTNADLTVQIYYLVKWALLSSRDILVTDAKLYRQRLSGSDFQPAPNFFPDFVYRRGITFWCQVTVSAPTYDIPYISEIDINQTIDFDTQREVK